MSSVVIAGNTNGSITLQAPDESGSSVLTLPVATDTLVGTNTIDTLSNKTLSAPVVDSLNDGQLAGLRNRIINGACNVQQRGALIASLGTNGLYGGPDRFSASNSAGGQFTQSTQVITFEGRNKYSVRQTVDTATTAFTTTNLWIGISQVIEGYNCSDLSGKTVTLSFLFNTNLTGTYSATIRAAGLTNSYVSTFSATANTPVKVSITTTIPSAALMNNNNTGQATIFIGTLNQATYQTATFNTWLAGNFISASTATNWAATAGNFIELTELQLEIGSVATPFEQRPYGMELALCQRYYETISALVIHSAFSAPSSSSEMVATWVFKVSKRATGAAIQSSTSITPSSISTDCAIVQLLTNPALNVLTFIGATASSEL